MNFRTDAYSNNCCYGGYGEPMKAPTIQSGGTRASVQTLPAGQATLPSHMNADIKQALLTQSAQTLVNGMKQAYGAGSTERSWNKDVMQQIATKGSFWSKAAEKEITVSPETRQAAQFILQNGGTTLFDRDGHTKDGIFMQHDLEHYINTHQTNHTAGVPLRASINRDTDIR